MQWRSSGTSNEASGPTRRLGSGCAPAAPARTTRTAAAQPLLQLRAGRLLRPLPLRLRTRAAMATLYIQVWGGWCSVHMDATVWCVTMLFTDETTVIERVQCCIHGLLVFALHQPAETLQRLGTSLAASCATSMG